MTTTTNLASTGPEDDDRTRRGRFTRTPLPQRFVTGTPAVPGRIKARSEDFLVEERSDVDPTGAGEHLLLFVEKEGLAHHELIRRLCRTFQVREQAIGYAGMKDKTAITRQLVSVHLPHGDPPSIDVPDEQVRVLWHERHASKLRRGQLAGNRFSIRIRETDPTRAPAVLRTLQGLVETGVPAYFGRQRFGARRNNHAVGARLILRDWAGALRELVGVGTFPFPEMERERRELFMDGRYEPALRAWARGDRAERSALEAMRRGQDPERACRAVGPTAYRFYLNAFQSAVFNHVVDRRVEQGTLGELHEGDLAWHHPTGETFLVTPDEIERGGLPPQLARFEVSPSGPLWGREMARADGPADEAERAALEVFDMPIDLWFESSEAPRGDRRPLRVAIEDIEVEGGADEHGTYIRVAFDLPPGAYATVVLREVLKAGIEADASQNLRSEADVGIDGSPDTDSCPDEDV